MKKFIALVLAVISVFSLAGCAAMIQPLPLDSVKPWATATGYEKTTYTIEKWSMIPQKKAEASKKDLLASGKLVFELDTAPDIDGVKYNKLTTSFNITYKNEECVPEIDRGLSDTISSEIIFQTDSLIPYSSKKTVNIAKRKDIEDMSYSIEALYDSANKKAIFTRGDDKKEIALVPDGAQYIYDNEQLYFLVRSMENLKFNTTTTFVLANTFDMFSSTKKPEWFTYNMKVVVSPDSEKKVISVPNLKNKYGLDDQGNITCMKSLISKNDKQPGPDKLAYYADTVLKVDGSDVKKLLVQLVEKEFDRAEEKYNLIYTLDSYTNVK